MQRGYPPVRESAFVAPMEVVLDLYCLPHDARRPVVCMDEQLKQLLSEMRTPQPAQPGRPATYDYEYVRHGSCTIWLFVEPLGQWRTANATARRTAVDWAHQVKALVDHPRYRQAEYLTLVCDSPRVRPGRLAAPEGLPAGRSGSVGRTARERAAPNGTVQKRLVFRPRGQRGLRRIICCASSSSHPVRPPE